MRHAAANVFSSAPGWSDRRAEASSACDWRTPRDLAALRDGMRIARDTGNSKAMKPFAKREILPGPVEGEALDNLIRNGALSMHHPAGTARMVTDEDAVRGCAFGASRDFGSPTRRSCRRSPPVIRRRPASSPASAGRKS